MTERPTGADEATPACPFVAFEDDRDARSAVPDHRHRCYAEVRPATRSLAHQDSYCVSAAFPACPTFLDWARREAARARTPAVPPPPAPTVNVEPAPLAPLPEKGPIYPSGPPPESPAAPSSAVSGGGGSGAAAWTGTGTTVGRSSRRDWAAPPPWMRDGSAAPAGSGSSAAEPPAAPPAPDRPDPSAGLAASAAAWLGDDPADDDEPGSAADAPPEGAATILPTRPRRPSSRPAAAALDDPDDDPDGDEQPVDGRRRSGRLPPRGPAWEEPIRGERFPTLRTPVGLPSLSPLVLWALALVAASVFLFFVPPMLIRLGEGGAAVATPTPTPTPAPTVETSPSPTPAPTPRRYVVVQNDTLSGIAARFGLTLEQLLAANPAISDPNRVVIGDELVIPTAPPETVPDGAAPSTVEDAGATPAP